MALIITILLSENARIPPNEISEEEARLVTTAITDFVESHHSSVSWEWFYTNENGVGIIEWNAPNVDIVESFYEDIKVISPDAFVAVDKMPL